MRNIRVRAENAEKLTAILRAAGYSATVTKHPTTYMDETWPEDEDGLPHYKQNHDDWCGIETDCSGNRAHSLWVEAGLVAESRYYKTKKYSSTRQAGFKAAYKGEKFDPAKSPEWKEGFKDFCPDCAMIGGYCGNCSGDYFRYNYNHEKREFEYR